MFQFFEPEDEYKTEKIKRRNLQTKINFFSALAIIGSFFVFSIQKDFIKVFGRESIGETCVFSNTFLSLDDMDNESKARKALSDHEGNLKELDRYLSSEVVAGDSNGIMDNFSILVYLDKRSRDKNRVPDNICGYKVITLTK